MNGDPNVKDGDPPVSDGDPKVKDGDSNVNDGNAGKALQVRYYEKTTLKTLSIAPLQYKCFFVECEIRRQPHKPLFSIS